MQITETIKSTSKLIVTVPRHDARADLRIARQRITDLLATEQKALSQAVQFVIHQLQNRQLTAQEIRSLKAEVVYKHLSAHVACATRSRLNLYTETYPQLAHLVRHARHHFQCRQMSLLTTALYVEQALCC
ncbi:MAG: hypothetical protein JST84_05175 [Acidobacteria bacterium]|nr:hypothetical protein [Acidobacteriota bacterium]